jgi:hypothetical protein
MKTLEFEMNVGITPGYFRHDEAELLHELVRERVMILTEQVFLRTQVRVGCTITPTHTLYPRIFGCPASGERTFLLCGLRNPEFGAGDVAWAEAVEQLGQMLLEEFQQSTVYLTFREVEFLYLKRG